MQHWMSPAYALPHPSAYAGLGGLAGDPLYGDDEEEEEDEEEDEEWEEDEEEEEEDEEEEEEEEEDEENAPITGQALLDAGRSATAPVKPAAARGGDPKPAEVKPSGGKSPSATQAVASPLKKSATSPSPKTGQKVLEVTFKVNLGHPDGASCKIDFTRSSQPDDLFQDMRRGLGLPQGTSIILTDSAGHVVPQLTWEVAQREDTLFYSTVEPPEILFIVSEEAPMLTGVFRLKHADLINDCPTWQTLPAAATAGSPHPSVATLSSLPNGRWQVCSPDSLPTLVARGPHRGIMPDMLKGESSRAILWEVTTGSLGAASAVRHTKMTRDETKWKGWRKEAQVKLRGVRDGFASSLGNPSAKPSAALASAGGLRRCLPLRHATALPRHQQYFPEQIEHASACTLDSAKGAAKMLVFGGRRGYAEENETYQLLASTLEWRRQEGKGALPWGRHGHTLNEVAGGRHVLLIGGLGTGGVGQSPTDDPATVEIEVSDIAPGVPNPDGGRQLLSEHDTWGAAAHAADLDSERTRLATVLRTAMGRPAGRRVRNTGFLRHCYRLDIKTGQWSLVLTDMSVFVAHHAAATAGHEVFTFGGIGLNRRCTNALKAIDTGVRCYYCKSQAYAMVPLETRRVHGIPKPVTFNSLFKRLGNDKANALWEGGTPEPMPESLSDTRPPKNCPVAWVCGPHLREEHDGVSFKQRSGTYHWRDVAAVGETPPPRYLHTMERFNNELVVFGGLGGDASFGDDGEVEPSVFLPADTYSYSLVTNSWAKVETNAGPSPRFGHAAAIAGSHMIISGGCVGQLRGSVSGNVSNEIWILELYKQVWTRLAAKGVPRLRNHTASVMSRVDGGVGVEGPSLVLFGGLLQEHDTWFVPDELKGDEESEFYVTPIPESEVEFTSDTPLGPIVRGTQGWYCPFYPRSADKALLKRGALPPGVAPGLMRPPVKSPEPGGSDGAGGGAGAAWLGPLSTSFAKSFSTEEGFNRRVIEIAPDKIDRQKLVGTFQGGVNGNVCVEDTPAQAKREAGLLAGAHFFTNEADNQRTAVIEHLATNYTWVVPLQGVSVQKPVEKEPPPVPPTLEKRIERLYQQKKKTEAHVHRLREMMVKESISASEPKIFPSIDFVEDFDSKVDGLQDAITPLMTLPPNTTKDLLPLVDEVRVIAGKLKQASELAVRRVNEVEERGDVPRPLQLWAIQEHIQNCRVALKAFMKLAKEEVPDVKIFQDYNTNIRKVVSELKLCKQTIGSIAQRGDDKVEAWFQKLTDKVKDRQAKEKNQYKLAALQEEKKRDAEHKKQREGNDKAVLNMKRLPDLRRRLLLTKMIAHGAFMSKLIKGGNLHGASTEAIEKTVRKASSVKTIFVKSPVEACSGIYTKRIATGNASPYVRHKRRVVWQLDGGDFFIARAPGKRWAIGQNGEAPIHITEEGAVGLPVKYPWCSSEMADGASEARWVPDPAVEVRHVVHDPPSGHRRRSAAHRPDPTGSARLDSPPPPPPPPQPAASVASAGAAAAAAAAAAGMPASPPPPPPPEPVRPAPSWQHTYRVGEVVSATREILFANGGRIAPGDVGEVTSVPGYAEDSPCQVRVNGLIFSAQGEDVQPYRPVPTVVHRSSSSSSSRAGAAESGATSSTRARSASQGVRGGVAAGGGRPPLSQAVSRGSGAAAAVSAAAPGGRPTAWSRTRSSGSRAGSSTAPGEGGPGGFGEAKPKPRSRLTPGQLEIQMARRANARGL